jgi:YggT family protein
MLFAIFWLVSELIHLMIIAIIVAAVLSMLVAFGVVNPRSPFVNQTGDFLTRVTNPVLAPIRNRLPYFGNVDISPLIAILLLEALSMILWALYDHLVLAGLAF